MDMLRIGLWNANGILQRRAEIELFLNHHKIDILLISETHFTDRNFFRIPHYKSYFTCHPDNRAHAGTAIIIRSNISHFEMEPFSTDHLQATSIQVNGFHGDLTISAAYCPPRHKITQNQFSTYFTTLGSKFISGGDFNAKHPAWGSRLINPKGRELHKCVVDNHYTTVSTGQPTYWPSDPNKLPDAIDFFVAKGISSLYFDASSCYDLTSDHSSLICTVGTAVIRKPKRATLSSRYTNWDIYREHLEGSLSHNMPLKTQIDIETATENLTKSIQYAAWHATPTPTDDCSDGDYNFPLTIRRKLSEKRKARRVWQHTRHPQDKNKLNALTTQLKRLIHEWKNATFTDYVRNLSPYSHDDYSLWKATKHLNRPRTPIPPLRQPNGTWARSDTCKANALGKYLSNVFQPHPATNSIRDDDIHEVLQAPLQLSPPLKPCTPSELEAEIKKLNKRKAPGYDLVTAKTLQELPRKGLLTLTHIINAVLRTQHIPIQWKFAYVVLIPKPGKPPTECSSYRPISLLPVISKLFEKILLKRLRPILEVQQLIPPHQFGFRQQHSSLDQVHRLVHIIDNAFNGKQVCSAAFLDVHQAFDRVWHPGLLYKIKVQLPHQYFLLFSSYLQDRHFQVILDDGASHIYDIKAGVPQGSVLGPVLYQLYTADLQFNDATIVATFADDMAFLSTHGDPLQAAANLQATLDDVQTWLSTWRIKVNESKSTSITFTLRHIEPPRVKLNGITIPQQDSVRYLGLHLDKRLTWKRHITSKRKELELKLKKYYWLLSCRSPLSLSNKLLLYKVCLIPIWSYGIQLWGCARTSNIDIIQRFQNKTLRLLTGAEWFVSNRTLHTDLNIPWVKDVIHVTAQRHFSRLSVHPSVLVTPLTAGEGNTVKRLKRLQPLDLVSS